MYDTKIIVKYYDIENELLDIFSKKKDECDYTKEDIHDICNKLYRDELLTVFGLETFDDVALLCKLDIIYTKMNKNDEFKQILNEVAEQCLKEILTFNNNYEKENAIKNIILTNLCSQDLFHMFHKCICQQIETSTIEKELLQELKNKLFAFFR